MKKKEVLSFVEEIAKVCKKHKIGIIGCGCCGSPYLISIKYIDIGVESVYLGDDGSYSYYEGRTEIEGKV